jgi:glutamate decarboxylase
MVLTCHSLASFVTTYMEPEVEKLMVDAFSKNFIDYEEYPVSADIQNRCVNMIARLFNIPSHDENTNAMGTSTIGSSEAIMLATLAMKKTWVNKRKAEGKDFSRPNIIMNSAVQVCWEKAARYFDVEEKYVYCTPDRYVIDPEEAVNLIDENTIGICSILGTTFTGEYEDTKKINDLLVERNIDCPIHVDAASGGFVAPFVNPDLEWDFRLEKVCFWDTPCCSRMIANLLKGRLYQRFRPQVRSRLPRCRLGRLARSQVPPQRYDHHYSITCIPKHS